MTQFLKTYEVKLCVSIYERHLIHVRRMSFVIRHNISCRMAQHHDERHNYATIYSLPIFAYAIYPSSK